MAIFPRERRFLGLVIVATVSIVCGTLHAFVGTLTCRDIQYLFGLANNKVECKMGGQKDKVDAAAHFTPTEIFVRAYERDDIARTAPHGIPKVVHQVYIDTRIATEYVPYVASIGRAMPDWMHVLWSDADVERFLLPRAGVSDADRALFKSYPHAVNRADMTRYLLMEHFGGMYLDLDAELLGDVEPELSAQGGVWTVEGLRQGKDTASHSPPKIETHMWVSQPKHPFWPVARQFLHARRPTLVQFDYDVVAVTGPRLVFEAYEAFAQRAKTKDGFGTFELFANERYNSGLGRADGVAHHHFVHEWLWVIKRVNIQRVVGYVWFLSMCAVLIAFGALFFCPRLFAKDNKATN